MRAYLQHFGRCRRKSGSSRFDKESDPRIERTTHASGVGPGGTIPGDFLDTTPPMIQGLSVRGARVFFFFLPRTGIPLSDVFHIDATHVSPLTL